MTFEGIVKYRSSKNPSSGPPGEREILRLNPKRADRICLVTGWPRLEPGSLNLAVPEAVVVALTKLKPLLVEDAAEIVYPAPYTNIPRMRGEYWYFPANASMGDLAEGVLVRRARVSVRGVVELFAPVNLTARFGLVENQFLRVEMTAT